MKTKILFLFFLLIILNSFQQKIFGQKSIKEQRVDIYNNYLKLSDTFFPRLFNKLDYENEINSEVKLLNSLNLTKEKMMVSGSMLFGGPDAYNKIPFWRVGKRARFLKKVYQKLLLDEPLDKIISSLKLDEPTATKTEIIDSIGQISADTYTNQFLIYERLKGSFDRTEYEYSAKLKIGEHLALVEDRLNSTINERYTLYKYANSSKELIKGVNIYHDNDFFIFPINEDKNYTGGGRIEVTTDLLKMRFFPAINNNSVLSYQGIFWGIEAYTPNIRKLGEAASPQRLESYRNDRPFATFQYWGRAKYRINPLGSIRSRSFIKVGKIGGNTAYNVQDILHRDQIQSPKVFGWNNQIANGGRLAWNIDHHIDIMVFSKAGSIFSNPYRISSFDDNKSEWEKKKQLKELEQGNKNFYIPTEIHIGNELTATGIGLGFSNKNFKKRGGGYDFSPVNHDPNQNPDTGLLIAFEGRYRYVLHNSLLEGFGLLTTNQPNPDYPLKNEKDVSGRYFDNRIIVNEIVRDVFYATAILAYRYKKATINIDINLNTKEFNRSKADNIYGWGRLGFSFLL